MSPTPPIGSSLPAQEVVVAAARYWRSARDRGEPVMPSLYAALERRYGCSLLVPMFDGLICACEACLGRRLATGDGAVLSSDERCLLQLIDDPSRDDPCFRGPDVDIAVLRTRACAACSAQIMLRLVLGRPDHPVANDPVSG